MADIIRQFAEQLSCEEKVALVCGQRWLCRGCGRSFVDSAHVPPCGACIGGLQSIRAKRTA